MGKTDTNSLLAASSKDKKLRKNKLKTLVKKKSLVNPKPLKLVENEVIDNEATGKWRTTLSNDAEAIQERKRIKQEKKMMRTPKNNDHKNEKKSFEAIEYITNWKNNRDNWKFKKMYQIYLVTNFLNKSCVPEENFSTLLEYFEKMQGNARKVAIDCAKLAISVADDQNLKLLVEEEGSSIAEFIGPTDKTVLERAQKVIALLES